MDIGGRRTPKIQIKIDEKSVGNLNIDLHQGLLVEVLDLHTKKGKYEVSYCIERT